MAHTKNVSPELMAECCAEPVPLSHAQEGLTKQYAELIPSLADLARNLVRDLDPQVSAWTHGAQLVTTMSVISCLVGLTGYMDPYNSILFSSRLSHYRYISFSSTEAMNEPNQFRFIRPVVSQ